MKEVIKMNNKYQKMLSLAIPYYEKGRAGDVEHVKWLCKTVPRHAPEELDLDVLMGVVILHDVGYSKVPKDFNPYDLKIRELHSREGAEIAKTILKMLSDKSAV